MLQEAFLSLMLFGLFSFFFRLLCNFFRTQFVQTINNIINQRFRTWAYLFNMALIKSLDELQPKLQVFLQILGIFGLVFEI